MHRGISQLISPTLFFQEAQILFDLLKVHFDRPTQRIDLQDLRIAQRQVGAQKEDPGVGVAGPNRSTEDQAHLDPLVGLARLGR